jgi:hypothetical protein
MVSTEHIVTNGRAAWARLPDHERRSWSDWIAVGHALVIGRTKAMQKAKTDKPLGSTYNHAMGQWLHANGLADIAAQERYRLLLIIENLGAIEAWRNSLDEAQRRRFNHPNSVWFSWRRAMKAREPQHRQHVVMAVKPKGMGPAP